MKNFVVWFEIPVKDLNRAMKFYSKVMAVEMQPMETGPSRMAFFSAPVSVSRTTAARSSTRRRSQGCASEQSRSAASRRTTECPAGESAGLPHPAS